MADTSTQLLTNDAYGVTFADPTDPDFTVRFKTTRNRKNLSGIQVDNFVTEIIINDLSAITVGSTTTKDTLAVRIRTSGSDLSHARLKAILAKAASQVSSWNSENVLLGFRPTTVPLNPSQS